MSTKTIQEQRLEASNCAKQHTLSIALIIKVLYDQYVAAKSLDEQTEIKNTMLTEIEKSIQTSGKTVFNYQDSYGEEYWEIAHNFDHHLKKLVLS